jgi:uncharacterized protein
MANREELGIIRGARAGQAAAQLELGRLYLLGSAGLPKSLPTALHWLERAAQQDCAEAWQLIGSHIPYELAQQSARPLAQWYERAYDAGQSGAGLVFARLVLADAQADAGSQAKARRALEAAAQAGLADAQWLIAQHQRAPQAGASAPVAGSGPDNDAWLKRAADNGVPQAAHALIERAWHAGQRTVYLRRALPLARALAAGLKAGACPAPDEALLLSRCAQALAAGFGAKGAACKDAGKDAPLQAELRRFRELAAHGNDRDAQLAFGLWLARMQVDGKRIAVGTGAANFKKAIRWLTLAGEQGMAEGWYALSRIYIKPEFSQRNVAVALAYLERAADMGYVDAQYECGNGAWRSRRENENNDVRALYWLQKAAAQGCAQAQAALDKIAPLADDGAWVMPSRALVGSHPFLAARIELAALFKLSRAEALLLDVKRADHGHCLVVDIRASYGRSKRRLVLLRTAQQRQALDRIVRLFENVDCGPNGPEGNYRQRLYRLKNALPRTMAPAPQQHGAPDELAA